LKKGVEKPLSLPYNISEGATKNKNLEECVIYGNDEKRLWKLCKIH
jgi:hypothetical protein